MHQPTRRVSKPPHSRSCLVTAIATLSAAVVLSACGGGSNSSAAQTFGAVSVAVTDAPTTDFDHVWITVNSIRFHKLDFARPDDPNWLTYPLAQPVTVDLTQLANGNLASVFGNIQLPVGTYRQIRLLLADDDATLTASAQADGLQFNDQVDYTDANGVAHGAALEIGGPREGISVFGTFTVSANTTLQLALDFNIDDDVIRFPDRMGGPGALAFTLKPVLHYFDLSTTGAIAGQVDTSALATLTNPSGAFGLVIKAESLAADGSRHLVTRATTIRPDGSFTLFPLPIAAGASSANFDILLRGRNMTTMLVRGVPVNVGTTPTHNPTAIAATALPLTASGEYTVSLSTALNPTGGWLNFFQTLPGASEVPYEVRFRNVNPFSGQIDVGFPLSASDLLVGDYVAAGSPTFVSTPPQQGVGGFSVRGGAMQYSASSFVPVVPPGSGTGTTISIPALVVDSTVADGVGTFGLPAGNLVDASGNTGNTIVSGSRTTIDKTPPAAPTNLHAGT